MEKSLYRYVNFDLGKDLLAQNYPASRREAYREVQNFFEAHGFIHRQRSAYCSIEKMTEFKFFLVLDNMFKKMPWLVNCARSIDATSFENYDQADVLLAHQFGNQSMEITNPPAIIKQVDLLLEQKKQKLKSTSEFLKKKVNADELYAVCCSGISIEIKSQNDTVFIQFHKADEEKIKQIILGVHQKQEVSKPQTPKIRR